MIRVSIDASAAMAKLTMAGRTIAPKRLNAVAGRAVLNLIKAHLRKRDTTPNGLGGKRTHYYAKAAQASHEEHDATQAIVTVSQTGFALQRYGGTVVPVNKRFLTIPLNPVAHGMRASDFPGAFVAHIKGKAYIADKPSKTGNMRLLFALVRKATINADPSVLPASTEIRGTAVTAISRFIARQLERAEKGATEPETT